MYFKELTICYIPSVMASKETAAHKNDLMLDILGN